MSRPACSILPPKYPPMAPAPTMRTRISQFLLLLDTGLSRTLLVRGFRVDGMVEEITTALSRFKGDGGARQSKLRR
jgi:hypothetical protein